LGAGGGRLALQVIEFDDHFLARALKLYANATSAKLPTCWESSQSAVQPKSCMQTKWLGHFISFEAIRLLTGALVTGALGLSYWSRTIK
jgi:hypothetical protein